MPLTARTRCQFWCRSTTDPSPSPGECGWFRAKLPGAPGPATARDKRAAGEHAPQAGILHAVHHASWAAAAKDSQQAWRRAHQHVQQGPAIDRTWRPERARVPDLRASTDHHQRGSDRPEGGYRTLAPQPAMTLGDRVRSRAGCRTNSDYSKPFLPDQAQDRVITGGAPARAEFSPRIPALPRHDSSSG